MLASLAPVRNWIFDLDNTLYPASADLFAQIDRRIGEYVAGLMRVDPVEARRLQKGWLHSHGTTLAGLMAEQDTDPHRYLAFVHDVDMRTIAPDPTLAAALVRLPGRRLVFTNGDAPYAARVLDRLGLTGCFEAVYDIHAAHYRPKPDPRPYRDLCDTYALDPHQSLFVEDMARNLKPAKALGMTTVWLDNGSEQGPDPDRSFVDYTIPDLTAWLQDIMENDS